MTINNEEGKKSKGPSILAVTALIISLIGLIVVVLLAILYNARINDVGKSINEIQESLILDNPEFIVSKFEINKNINYYEYIDDTVSYIGDGLITEKTGNKGDFLVIVKQTLISGGSGDKGKVTYLLLPVVNGFGEFTTYDYGPLNETDEPEYQFDIIGNIQINKKTNETE